MAMHQGERRPRYVQQPGVLANQLSRPRNVVVAKCEERFIMETYDRLIEERRLAELMIDFGVGVSVVASYEIKKIDGDFFVEE